MQMSKIYDTAFRMGVLFSIFLFTILNVLSLTVTKKRAEEITFGIGGSNWGFPFDWEGKFFNVIEGGGAIMNILVAVACSFMFGFLSKFAWPKISQPRAELK
jgi:hypothetical protein